MTIKLVSPPPMPSHPRRRDGKVPLPTPEERARLRHAWRLTPRQVADAFGVTAATVRSWEAGRSTPTGLRRAAYAAFLSGLAQGLAPAAVPGPAAGERARAGGSGNADGARKRDGSASADGSRRGDGSASAEGSASGNGSGSGNGNGSRGGDGGRAASGAGRPPRQSSRARTRTLPRHASRTTRYTVPAPKPEAAEAAAVDVVRPARPAPVVARTTAVLAGRAAPVTGVPVGAGPDPVPLVRRRRLRAMAVGAAVWTAFVHIMITSPPPHL